MSGSGRKSHYRKHLQNSVLNEFPEPKGDERIAKVVSSSRGGNFFDVVVPPSTSIDNNKCNDDEIEEEEEEEEIKMTPKLALLPTKFRRLVWIKRGDYVIVDCGTDPDVDGASPAKPTDDNNDDAKEQKEVGNKKSSDENIDNSKLANNASSSSSKTKGVRYIIQHVLYKEQIKHLKQKGLWPNAFSTSSEKQDDETEELKPSNHEDTHYLDNTEEYLNDYLDESDLLMNANTNRMAHLTVDDDESSSSSDEE